VILAFAALACAGPPEAPAVSHESIAPAADATVMFVDIEGTLDELRALRGIEGLELERGASNVRGDRFHVGAFVRRRSALRAVEARGLMVRIVMDEAEARRRMAAEQEAMRRAAEGD
jgi:hypothetical protein